MSLGSRAGLPGARRAGEEEDRYLASWFADYQMIDVWDRQTRYAGLGQLARASGRPQPRGGLAGRFHVRVQHRPARDGEDRNRYDGPATSMVRIGSTGAPGSVRIATAPR